MKKAVSSGDHNGKLYQISLVMDNGLIYYELFIYNREQFISIDQQFDSTHDAENYLRRYL